MSDRMRPIAFSKLVNWMINERKEQNTIFGIHQNKFYRNRSGTFMELFKEKISSPIGPAAGPHTQLTQNIIASYLTGSRFIELKTVQTLDGEDLPVSKPCIYAEDEGYNVEWSTELRVEDAFNEYVKAWILLHVFMKELQLSETRDFMFNMSVGYDLEGIKSKKIDDFIDNLKDAKDTEIWKESINYLLNHMDLFSHLTKEDVLNISPHITNSITLSTLHGCPPQEIERIVNYLLKEKKLYTFIKMNPTLLGEEFVRDTLNQMGYEYISLNGHHFKADLQYPDAIEMINRLKTLATSIGLEVGVKLTNTLPVKILNEELPGEEMYMSGRALYPLTINLAKRLSNDFNGKLKISYSGGVDFFNVDKILETGIEPVTFATTLLKPGGYERITQMAKKVEKSCKTYDEIDVLKLGELAFNALQDKHHLKDLRTVKSRKLNTDLPLLDCQVAPCTNGCPINQQIPEYLKLVHEKRYDEAFSIIVKDNASPFITGTICNHMCQTKCTRVDYDESVKIREMKKIAVLNAQSDYIEKIIPSEIKREKKVVVIGAGPAGLSAALFLRRNGLEVTVLEKREKPYGMIQYVIPNFRISEEAINADYELVKRHGVKFNFGVQENYDIDALKKEYDYVVIATGTWKSKKMYLEEGQEKVLHALHFLENFNEDKKSLKLGKNVLVIGGGDVAMDAARAAKRVNGVENVLIVYRRTKEYMPASLEELNLAISDGVVVKELLSPLSYQDDKLLCQVMKLGEKDQSGRRKPIATGEVVSLEGNSVIMAIGEEIDASILKQNGIKIHSSGYPEINQVNETNLRNVYVAGDMKQGPATIVKAIADGKTVAKSILTKEGLNVDFDKKEIYFDEEVLYERKGILANPLLDELESGRCLACHKICELCVDVCPNRANMMIKVNHSHQIIHLDGMCNECGNCGVFCPHIGDPYKDKITVFWSETDFLDSTNVGFYVVDKDKGSMMVREVDGSIKPYTLGENRLNSDLEMIIKTVVSFYPYIL